MLRSRTHPPQRAARPRRSRPRPRRPRPVRTEGLRGRGLLGHTSCTLVAEQEEGPYYLDLDKVRKNITEGKSGVRLDLRIKIVDRTNCDPLKGSIRNGSVARVTIGVDPDATPAAVG